MGDCTEAEEPICLPVPAEEEKLSPKMVHGR